MEGKKKLSRREFLRLAGLGLGSVAVANVAAAPSKVEQSFKGGKFSDPAGRLRLVLFLPDEHSGGGTLGERHTRAGPGLHCVDRAVSYRAAHAAVCLIDRMGGGHGCVFRRQGVWQGQAGAGDQPGQVGEHGEQIVAQ